VSRWLIGEMGDKSVSCSKDSDYQASPPTARPALSIFTNVFCRLSPFRFWRRIGIKSPTIKVNPLDLDQIYDSPPIKFWFLRIPQLRLDHARWTTRFTNENSADEFSTIQPVQDPTLHRSRIGSGKQLGVGINSSGNLETAR
jgi:hypothetical protein